MRLSYEEQAKNELEAKVKSVNQAHKYANELRPILTELFRPLVGEKVEKADGQLLEKVKKLLPAFPCTPQLNVYKLASSYSLAWCVKACNTAVMETDGCGVAQYYEVTVYIGDLTGQTLTRLCESYQQITHFRTDYTAKEVLANRQKAEVAKKAYEQARSDCFPFGE